MARALGSSNSGAPSCSVRVKRLRVHVLPLYWLAVEATASGFCDLSCKGGSDTCLPFDYHDAMMNVKELEVTQQFSPQRC